MTRTNDVAAGAQKTQRQVLQRRSPHRMLSYDPVQRVVDGWQARRAARASSCTDIDETPLAHRLRWTYNEAANRLLVQAQAVNHQQIRRLEENVQLLQDADAEVTQRRIALEGMADPDLGRRQGAEQHLSDETVATRRRRDAAADRAVVRSELERVERRRDALRAACRADAADLREQFELLLAADSKLRAYAHRRAANYGRAWDAVRDTPSSDVTIPAPAWVDGTFPWLPAGYERLVSGLNSLPKPVSGIAEEEK